MTNTGKYDRRVVMKVAFKEWLKKGMSVTEESVSHRSFIILITKVYFIEVTVLK
ncbi:MAG: hypothetical protein HZR80_00075 [Candidatus Heimdallarchaeota archaeon]